MSAYVERIGRTGHTRWVGPIRSMAQAQREADAWVDAGFEGVRVHESTPEIAKRARADTAAYSASVNGQDRGR